MGIYRGLMDVTPEMEAEAARNPGGWVYKVDWNYRPDQYTPPEAIVGYMPKSGTQFSNEKWGVNWSNPSEVFNAQKVRLAYHDNLLAEKDIVTQMISAGKPSDDIARHIVQLRNETRLSFYSAEQLPIIKERNIAKYGNEFGPTYEDQLKKYGSPQAVIEAGTRSNTSMDILTGIAKVVE